MVNSFGKYLRRMEEHRARRNVGEDDLNNVEFVADNEGEINGAARNPQGALPGQVQDMEVDDQLGLEPEMNPQVDNNSQGNEEPSSSDSLIIITSPPPHSPGSWSSTNAKTDNKDRASDLMAVTVCADPNKAKITELAVAAMEELRRKALEGEPLWQRSADDETEVLNGFQYMREFGTLDETLLEIIKMIEVGEPQFADCNFDVPLTNEEKPMYNPLGLDPLNVEASRDVCFVNMSPPSIVDLLMDLNKWSSAFCNIVTRAMLVGVQSAGSGAQGCDGKLQVMSAEFILPSVLVPIRESYFARYCKQLAPDSWAVVDVSLESLFPYPLVRFRRKPSGCLIQELPNGCSKITWVEHVEVDDRFLHDIFKPLVTSGYAFCAKRWLTSITRHCDEHSSVMTSTNLIRERSLILQAGRESLMKLAERMMRNFCQDMNASTANPWTPLHADGAQDIMVMTRNINVPQRERPHTGTLLFTTSVCLPSSPKRVFDFLRDVTKRTKWDMLSHGKLIRELAYVLIGKNPPNRVSIVQANSSPTEIDILYLQKTYQDITGSYVIYAPMDIMAMSSVLNGCNPDSIALLASGFAILPNKPITKQSDEHNLGLGCLLTIAYHIIDHAVGDEYVPPGSVDTIHEIIRTTAEWIKDALVPKKQNNNLPGHEPSSMRVDHPSTPMEGDPSNSMQVDPPNMKTNPEGK